MVSYIVQVLGLPTTTTNGREKTNKQTNHQLKKPTWKPHTTQATAKKHNTLTTALDGKRPQLTYALVHFLSQRRILESLPSQNRWSQAGCRKPRAQANLLPLLLASDSAEQGSPPSSPLSLPFPPTRSGYVKATSRQIWNASTSDGGEPAPAPARWGRPGPDRLDPATRTLAANRRRPGATGLLRGGGPAPVPPWPFPTRALTPAEAAPVPRRSPRPPALNRALSGALGQSCCPGARRTRVGLGGFSTHRCGSRSRLAGAPCSPLPSAAVGVLALNGRGERNRTDAEKKQHPTDCKRHRQIGLLFIPPPPSSPSFNWVGGTTWASENISWERGWQVTKTLATIAVTELGGGGGWDGTGGHDTPGRRGKLRETAASKVLVS